jgi:4-methoxybenzoate monooxygenase (O-demethylating)
MAAPCPVRDLDPFSPEFLTDPYPAYEAMRETGEVVWLARYDIWAAARHASVSAVLRDAGTFCSSAGVGLSNFRTQRPWRRPSPLSETDPPEHSRVRGVVSRVLSASAINRWGGRFRSVSDEFVARLAHGEPFEAMTDLANAYPLQMFSEIFGLPDEHRDSMLRGARIVWNPPSRTGFPDSAPADAGPSPEWILKLCGVDAFLPGGMGGEIHRHAAAEGFTLQESAVLVRTLLSAGVDTTAHALGNALWCLATHPEQYARLHADPSRARAAFEEVLRFESPSPVFFRTTTREVDFAEVTVPANTKIMLLMGAANRDPRRWPAPDRFDISRAATGHLAFGGGIHTCLGTVLARWEGEALLEALARRVSAIELADEPRRMVHKTLRGLESLSLRLVP